MTPDAHRYFRWPWWLVRALWPARNVLLRRCDRAEAMIAAVLLAALCAGVPTAVLAVGNWLYAAGTALLLVVLLAGAWIAAHRVVDRRRMDAWEADWSVTGPRWTSKL